jgi:hypothetical protein
LEADEPALNVAEGFEHVSVAWLVEAVTDMVDVAQGALSLNTLYSSI